jgi:hypothetical protein
MRYRAREITERDGTRRRHTPKRVMGAADLSDTPVIMSLS